MDKLQEWKTLLPKIQIMLDQAEAQETAPSSVGTWLSDLKFLAYDMEDVLDEFEFEVKTAELQTQAQAGASTSRPSKRPKHSESSLPNLSALLPKINDITIKLQQIEREANLLKLIKENVSLPTTPRSRRPPSTSLTESHVYGREEDRLAILDLLQREDHEHGVCVIPLVGMGGIGKTTLAQLVYNDVKLKAQLLNKDENVKNLFDLKAWVCVSDQFDILRVTKSVLQGVAPELVKEHELDNLDLLQTKLKRDLSRKKFLLVLDDVWNLNYEQWNILHKPFLEGAAGSKIIVTTRDYGVASMMKMGCIQSYTLKVLSHSETMKLFSQHALGAESFEACLHLKPLAEEIVGRCKGLPLAAKTLGGLLRGKMNKRDWEKLLNSKIWDLPNEKSDIIPALRLSYYHLSSELKRCFTYCAIFPKDYEFDKEVLVLLWMAEGFLKQSNEIMTMEELGYQYFDELLSKGFFQPSNAYVSKFVMHDLIHDLAQSISGSNCFHLPDGMEGNDSQATWGNIFHFSFMTRYVSCEKYQKFEVLNKAKRLRTFLALHIGLLLFPMHSHAKISFRVLDELLPELKCLRVLSLRAYKIGNELNGIGGVKHLRHLDLSYSSICSIPESVTNLIFLQTVLAKDCRILTKLPDGIGKLIDLHHLDISGTDSLKEMPIGIHKLKNLQTLSKFIVSKVDRGLSLRHLKDLSNVRGKLSIKNLENVEDVQDAEEANLETKKGLVQLTLKWHEDFTTPRIDEINKEMQVLNHLRPHQHLERFKISGYSGIEIPSWMDDLSFFSSLSFLELRSCINWVSLPSVGRLPSLKELILKDMEVVQVIGVEFFYGNDIDVSCESFKALEKLSFENMCAWEHWSFDNGCECDVECRQMFPKLSELKISNCPKLRGNLPDCHSKLKKLIIFWCPELTISIRSLPSLEELEINRCRAVVFKNKIDLNSLTTLTMKCVLEQVNVVYEVVADALMKVDVDINNLNLLIDGKGWKMGMKHLEQLSIDNLSLPYMPQQPKSFLEEVLQFNNSCNLRFLKKLNLYSCGHLQTFSLGKLPATIESIEIMNCGNLQSLTSRMMGDCCNTTPSALKELRIDNCKRLQSFSKRILWTLETLMVRGCHSLESLAGNTMPSNNLKRLQITDCKNLKWLPDGFHQLIFLEILVILLCPSIETFPERGLPPNLEYLVVDCENMKQPITEWSLDKLHSLKTFWIYHICPPDGLLPPSLTSFKMLEVKKLKSISKDLLRNLTNLKHLSFSNCPELSCFPKDVCLPPTLNELRMRGCPHLENKCGYMGEYWNLLAHIPRLQVGTNWLI